MLDLTRSPVGMIRSDGVADEPTFHNTVSMSSTWP